MNERFDVPSDATSPIRPPRIGDTRYTNRMSEFGEPGIILVPEVAQPPSFEQSMQTAGVPQVVLDARKDLPPVYHSLIDLEIWAISGADVTTVPIDLLERHNVFTADKQAKNNAFYKVWDNAKEWKDTHEGKLQKEYTDWTLAQGNKTLARLIGINTSFKTVDDTIGPRPPTTGESAMIYAQAIDEVMRHHALKNPTELALHGTAGGDIYTAVTQREENWTGTIKKNQPAPLTADEFAGEMLSLCTNATKEVVRDATDITTMPIHEPAIFILGRAEDEGPKINPNVHQYSHTLADALRDIRNANESLRDNTKSPHALHSAIVAAEVTYATQSAINHILKEERHSPGTDYRSTFQETVEQIISKCTQFNKGSISYEHDGVMTVSARLLLEGVTPAMVPEQDFSRQNEQSAVISETLKHVLKADETHYDVEVAKGAEHMTGRMLLINDRNKRKVEPADGATPSQTTDDASVTIRIPRPSQGSKFVPPSLPGYVLSETTESDGKLEYTFQKSSGEDPYKANLSFTPEQQETVTTYLSERFPNAFKRKFSGGNPKMETLRSAIKTIRANSVYEYADATSKIIEDPDDFVKDGTLTGTCGVSAAFVRAMIRECNLGESSVLSGIAIDGVPHAQVALQKDGRTIIVDATPELAGGHTPLPEPLRKHARQDAPALPLTSIPEIITRHETPIEPAKRLGSSEKMLSAYFANRMGIEGKKIPGERKESLVVKHVADLGADDIARRTFQQIYRGQRLSEGARDEWSAESDRLKKTLHTLIERGDKPADAVAKPFGSYRPHELKMFLQALELAA